MSQYSRLIITKQGQNLLSEILAGNVSGVRFTKICISSAEYDLSELETLTELAEIRQTALVSHAEKSGESAVMVEAAFSNENLTEGYYMRTLGLYAEDGQGAEILYAVTVEQSGNCYMPPFNGSTISGALVNLVAAVGNAENISLEADSAAVATINDIKRLENALAEHNTSPEAHSGFQGELSRLGSEVDVLKLRVSTDITANEFSVTFENLDGLSVDGVYNIARGRIDF